MTRTSTSRLLQPIFFPQNCRERHIKHDKRETGLFKEEIRCTGNVCLWSETYCCLDKRRDKIKFSSRGLIKRTLQVTDGGLWKKTDVYSTRKRLFNQQNGVSKQFNILCAYTIKQRENCHIFSQNELFLTMEFTHSHLLL